MPKQEMRQIDDRMVGDVRRRVERRDGDWREDEPGHGQYDAQQQG